ncbi:MAG: hypothetical protein FWG55_02165 [Candidatus Bathyarchaeota archaeon]|nr:hypothetical protein [Candidatus Termiticorpusculum sp.]
MAEPKLPQWAHELKSDIQGLLSEEYQRAARWKIDDEDCLILDFPAIHLSDLDFKSGLTCALREFHGLLHKNYTTLQTELIFPRPPTPGPTGVVSSYPAVQKVGNTTTTAIREYEKGKIEVKNMNNNLTMEAYLQKNNNLYVSKTNSHVGDIFRVVSPFYFEEQEFKGEKKTSCFIDVEKEPSREKMKIRLNKENAANLVGIFTTDGNKWIGQRVRILKLQRYNIGEGFIYAPT